MSDNHYIIICFALSILLFSAAILIHYRSKEKRRLDQMAIRAKWEKPQESPIYYVSDDAHRMLRESYLICDRRKGEPARIIEVQPKTVIFS